MDYNKLSEFYKVFADPTRLMILNALKANRMCVSGIALTINKSQSLVSHQLTMLRNLNLVKTIKVGQSVMYELSDKHINDILSLGISHIEEGKN